jgi:putative alpha-1,2-mannosidase
VYEIGSPIFEKSEIQLANGKQFTVVAHNVSAQNKYIQSAQLNGKPLNKPWFGQSDIANGGTLTLEMADRPNVQWGSSPEAVPPAMNEESATSHGTE